MVKKPLGLGVALTAAAGSVLFLAPAAQAATSAVIHVPSDFVQSLSDTRANGHYDVTPGGGLHILTDGSTDIGGDGKNSDKVAEYVATNKALADVGEPSLDYTTESGGAPGFQLVVDFDGNGTPDGILVGESVYDGDWWASNDSAQFVKDGAPSHEGGSGSTNHGTLDQWRAAFPNASVQDFGFSLGSGVQGEGIINALDFVGTSYTFANDVILRSKDECKDGGWATSTAPVYKNQGQCVSHFAESSNNGSNAGNGTSTGTNATASAGAKPTTPPSLGAIPGAGGTGGRVKAI